MTRPTLVTDRIRLCPMTLEHLPLLHLLDSDPEVMRYLLGRARTPAEIDEFWAPRCADVAADALGLGWWVGFQGDEFLGWWDLHPGDAAADTPARDLRPEAGWRLRRRFWQQGLATEGARALVEHAIDTVGAAAVWAETMAVNAGSRGVMRSLGMRHVRTYHGSWPDPLPGTELGEVVYEITAEEWRARHASRG